MAEQKPMSPEELQAFLATNPPSQPMQGPQFYASQFQVLWTANTCTILFLQPRPTLAGAPGQQVLAATMEAVASIHLSPQAAKDLSLLLPPTVQNYERDWGQMKTEYSLKLASERSETNKSEK